MSSAICFNLNLLKFLLSDNGFSQKDPSLSVSLPGRDQRHGMDKEHPRQFPLFEKKNLSNFNVITEVIECKLSCMFPNLQPSDRLYPRLCVPCSVRKGRLTHYHTTPHFDALKIYSFGKHCEKRRNCLKQAISPFFTMFSTLYDTYFSF